jgi:hypothetical protein
MGNGAESEIPGDKGFPPASLPPGTGTAVWQYGHLTFLPADSSRALNRFPHEGHDSVIGIEETPHEVEIGRAIHTADAGHGKAGWAAEEPRQKKMPQS